MRLFHSAFSPFARKVMVCASARDIAGQIELVPTVASESPPALLAANPLSKIPALVTEDGLALYDSPVICEYLDSIGDALPMFPASGGARWQALRHQALGDGMSDAAVLRRGEGLRPHEAARESNMRRQREAIERALLELEGDLPHGVLDIGTASIGCALGYLDARFAHEPWRERAPRLAAWYARLAEHAAFVATAPRDAA